ncbi:hypothetical protein [Lacticaseibacillus nasuensis]|uniref:hypothetical protein n=1 Tax=Lacticaseibacillus nasuensis TaxID=944671 RepID=UPI0015853AE8|nr:hypothetical protein [Lacticaseibacillus nasuensis]
MTDYAFYQSGVREAQFRVTAGQAELTWTAGGTGALDWAALSAWARLPLEPWLTTIAGARCRTGPASPGTSASMPARPIRMSSSTAKRGRPST